MARKAKSKDRQSKPRTAQAPPRKAETKTPARAIDGFETIPLKPPIKWPLFEVWAEDAAGGNRSLLLLIGDIERWLGRKLRGRVHAEGPFIEVQLAEDPTELPGLAATTAWLVEKLEHGGHPFGGLAWACGRLYLAPPIVVGDHTMWGEVLEQRIGEPTPTRRTVNPWRGATLP